MTLSKIFERVIIYQLCDNIEKRAVYKPNTVWLSKRPFNVNSIIKTQRRYQESYERKWRNCFIWLFKGFWPGQSRDIITKVESDKFFWKMHSYLSDRKQFVQVDHCTSDTSAFYFDVPQGGILGPMFFNLYVIDLSQNMLSIWYADNTTLYKYYKVFNSKSCALMLQNDLENLSEWSNEQNLLF